MRMGMGLSLVAMLLAFGCDEPALELVVDLKSDWVPGREVSEVDVEVESDERMLDLVRTPVTGAVDFAGGVRVAELDALAKGDYQLHVRLLDAGGALVDETNVLVQLTESLGITVIMSRLCRGVTCPGPGDAPNLTRCVAGRCVDEGCSEAAPERCGPPACATDAECTALSECAPGACEMGFCYVPPSAALCHESEACEPETGCVLDPGFVDDTVAACTEWTDAHFDPCALSASNGDVVLDEPGTYVYDTEGQTLETPMGAMMMLPGDLVDEARVVPVDRLIVLAGSTLRAEGRYPLVVAAFATITVDGVIDVSSDRRSASTEDGAGAGTAACDGAQNGRDGGGSAGGGGGGGYQGSGGVGGSGTDAPTGSGGAGGGAIALPSSVRGGCGGASGGRGDAARGQPGRGGGGGGAVELAAARAVLVRGVLHAGGGGGGRANDAAGETNDHGGGGAGSGGLVSLEAPFSYVGASATLAANGGGGGGSSASMGDGANGTPDAMPAAGGAPGVPGGGGGAGSAADALDGENGTNGGEGGGGGGGGAGFIVLRAASINVKTGAVVSPAATRP
jgi:hypothetical protein